MQFAEVKSKALMHVSLAFQSRHIKGYLGVFLLSLWGLFKVLLTSFSLFLFHFSEEQSVGGSATCITAPSLWHLLYHSLWSEAVSGTRFSPLWVIESPVLCWKPPDSFLSSLNACCRQLRAVHCAGLIINLSYLLLTVLFQVLNDHNRGDLKFLAFI